MNGFKVICLKIILGKKKGKEKGAGVAINSERALLVFWTKIFINVTISKQKVYQIKVRIMFPFQSKHPSLA